MARRLEVPVEKQPARVDLRDALPDWYWMNGPGFKIWGGSILPHVTREHWHEFDRRFMYRVDADGGWTQTRAVPGNRS